MVIAATDVTMVAQGFSDAMQRFRRDIAAELAANLAAAPAVAQKQKLAGRGKKERAARQGP
jgi:hypothetical protein